MEIYLEFIIIVERKLGEGIKIRIARAKMTIL